MFYINTIMVSAVCFATRNNASELVETDREFKLAKVIFIHIFCKINQCQWATGNDHLI